MGDQLTLSLPCLTEADKTHDLIWLCEVKSEATHVRHHKKKIAFLFSAMRHFAKELEEQGYRVHYTRLDDPQNGGSFKGEIIRALKAHQPQRLALTEPSEYHLLEEVKG